MNAELGMLPNGDIVLACDQQLPDDVKRIEYYKDQRLMMLVYNDPEHEGDLMNCELPEDTARKLERRAHDLMIVDNALSQDARGYHVPLIQVGV